MKLLSTPSHLPTSLLMAFIRRACSVCSSCGISARIQLRTEFGVTEFGTASQTNWGGNVAFSTHVFAASQLLVIQSLLFVSCFPCELPLCVPDSELPPYLDSRADTICHNLGPPAAAAILSYSEAMLLCLNKMSVHDKRGTIPCLCDSGINCPQRIGPRVAALIGSRLLH